MQADMSIVGLFLQASLVVKLVMIALVVLSIMSWAMIIQRVKVIKEAKKGLGQFEERFWSGIDLSKLYGEITSRRIEAESAALVFQAGYKEFSRLMNQKGTGPEAVMDGTHRAMRVAMSRQVDGLEQNLSFLATVGSTSPYIGLFGTVWGIMNAFIALGQIKQATLAMVAPGIAEALIATAMGLFAAIPAVIFYNRFAHDVEHLETQLENFVDEFSGILHRKAHSTPS